MIKQIQIEENEGLPEEKRSANSLKWSDFRAFLDGIKKIKGAVPEKYREKLSTDIGLYGIWIKDPDEAKECLREIIKSFQDFEKHFISDLKVKHLELSDSDRKERRKIGLENHFKNRIKKIINRYAKQAGMEVETLIDAAQVHREVEEIQREDRQKYSRAVKASRRRRGGVRG